MDQKDDADLGPDAASKRACDSCRTRKIRCDRNAPCSNCRASKLTCITTAPTQKAQRQRIHISEEYEKKIDRIEDRLASIEHVLEALASKLGSIDLQKDYPQERSSASRSSRSGTARGSNDADAATPAPFEGDTTINSQSEFARELLAQAIGSTPSMEQNAEVKAALTSLRDLVSRQGSAGSTRAESQSFFNRSFAGIDAAKLERPPWDLVNQVLEEASSSPTMSFAFLFPFLKVQNLRSQFEEAFERPEECPAGRRLLVYSVLYNLFTEFAAIQPGDIYRVHISNIKLQVELALSQLDICVLPDYENIVALVMGAAYAVEICKPSLCWLMVSRAAGLAQDLGYHRISTMKDDNPDDRSAKIHVFWMIYIFDKTLSLRLGRASVIQDWDISLPFFFGGEQAPNGTEILLYWIKVAQVQGQTYEKLFSPAAFLQPPQDRARAALELVNLMNKAWLERGAASVTDLTQSALSLRDSVPRIVTQDMDPSGTSKGAQTEKTNTSPQQPLGSTPVPKEYMGGDFGSYRDIFYHADVVMHYSTCALIQRAVSPDNVTFTQECLESSRAALVAHMRCNAQYNVKGKEDLWAGYVHWSILQAPFTPFIVIFCNVVLHCNLQDSDSLADFNSLADFVHSLDSCRSVSEGAEKLYKMCHIFLQVAKAYVDAKTQEGSAQKQAGPAQGSFYATPNAPNTDPGVNATAQFDPYLSALGLVPNANWPMTPSFPAPTNVDAFTQGHGLDETLAAGMGVGVPFANQNTVQDWFSGSRQLMSLLEDDIQMPDFGM